MFSRTEQRYDKYFVPHTTHHRKTEFLYEGDEGVDGGASITLSFSVTAFIAQPSERTERTGPPWPLSKSGLTLTAGLLLCCQHFVKYLRYISQEKILHFVDT